MPKQGRTFDANQVLDVARPNLQKASRFATLEGNSAHLKGSLRALVANSPCVHNCVN